MHLIDQKLIFVAIYLRVNLVITLNDFEGNLFETNNWIIDLSKSVDGNVWKWGQTNEEFLGTMRYLIM